MAALTFAQGITENVDHMTINYNLKLIKNKRSLEVHIVEMRHRIVLMLYMSIHRSHLPLMSSPTIVINKV